MTIVLVVVAGLIIFIVYMIRMPGESFKGALPPLDEAGIELMRKLQQRRDAGTVIVCARCANNSIVVRTNDDDFVGQSAAHERDLDIGIVFAIDLI